MKLSKLTFNLQEIPDGRSHRNIRLEGQELTLDEHSDLKEAEVRLDFYKTEHFIQVEFTVTGLISMRCDRSLRKFTESVSGSYQVLFEPDSEEEIETEKGAVRQIPPDDLVIDVQKEVRDTVMLSLPVRKIHHDYRGEDGKPEDFETRRYGTVPEGEETIDPRWAELKKLKN